MFREFIREKKKIKKGNANVTGGEESVTEFSGVNYIGTEEREKGYLVIINFGGKVMGREHCSQ